MNLSQVTTAELVEELKKRSSEVVKIPVTIGDGYAIYREGFMRSIKDSGVGPATILVVRE